MTIKQPINDGALDRLISDYAAATSKLSNAQHELEHAHAIIWALIHRQGGEVALTPQEIDRAEVLDVMLDVQTGGVHIRAAYTNSTIAAWPADDEAAIQHAQDEMGAY